MCSVQGREGVEPSAAVTGRTRREHRTGLNHHAAHFPLLVTAAVLIDSEMVDVRSPSFSY